MASPVLCCVAAKLVKLCIMAIPIIEFQVREYNISKVLFWLGFFTKHTIFTIGTIHIKVIIEKSRGEVSPMGQDTIENVS